MTTVEPNTPAAPDRMAQFHHHNGKFDGGTRVHTVATQPWIANLTVPGPACHTGNASFDPDVFQPTTAPVDCLRCIRLGPTPPTAGTPDPNQLALALCTDTTSPWITTRQPLPAYL